jgi:BirA family biotin operon repressor/biotin-[acetyl-CoA-carboxylase] ligase
MPPRSGIASRSCSAPDDLPPAKYGWLPLLAGVAVVEAVRRVADVDAALKWPNDLLVGGRKCGGVLVEVHDGAVVVGIGVNTSLTAAELPVPAATSLALAGAAADRDPLLRRCCAGSPTTTGSGWRRAATRWRPGCGRTTCCTARPSAARCASTCRAARASAARPRTSIADGGSWWPERHTPLGTLCTCVEA